MEDPGTNREQGGVFRAILKFISRARQFISAPKMIEILYFLAYWILIPVALTKNDLIITFHLSIIVIRSSVIKNLLNAILSVLWRIILTLVISIIFVYWFAVWAYSTRIGTLYPNSSCNTLFKCFFATFDQTFKNDGGVGPYTDGTEKAYENTTSKTSNYIISSHQV